MATTDLHKAYRDAQAKFRKSGSDEDRQAFKDAKAAFVAERTARKRQEAADPSHPRQHRLIVVGASKGRVTYDDGTSVEV